MITWYNATVPQKDNIKSYNFGFSVDDKGILEQRQEYGLPKISIAKNSSFRKWLVENNISVVKIAVQYETEEEYLFAKQLNN